MKTHFQVKYYTHFGQNLYVCGSLLELGLWNSRNGKRMQYMSNGIWDCTVDLPLKPGSKVGYKYCILDDKQMDGGIPLWEPSLDHEREVQEDQKTLECSDMWGSGKQVQEIYHLHEGHPNDKRGRLLRGPMPFSKIYDPIQTTYAELSSYQVDVIVCLAFQKELEARTEGVDLMELYGKDGYAVIYFPIPDFNVPDNVEQLSTLIDKIEDFLQKGCNVYIHCHAGIGRAGLVLSCWAKRFLAPKKLIKIATNATYDTQMDGETLPDVIIWTRSMIRGAVQTKEQVKFVEEFDNKV